MGYRQRAQAAGRRSCDFNLTMQKAGVERWWFQLFCSVPTCSCDRSWLVCIVFMGLRVDMGVTLVGKDACISAFLWYHVRKPAALCNSIGPNPRQNCCPFHCARIRSAHFASCSVKRRTCKGFERIAVVKSQLAEKHKQQKAAWGGAWAFGLDGSLDDYPGPQFESYDDVIGFVDRGVFFPAADCEPYLPRSGSWNEVSF